MCAPLLLPTESTKMTTKPEMMQKKKSKSNNDKKKQTSKNKNSNNNKNKKDNKSKNKNKKQPQNGKKKNKKSKAAAVPKNEVEQEMTLEEQARYLALDCEMVGVGEGGYRSALARVSIVDYNNAVLFDTYVQVSEPVTDYRTFVSGIREEHLHPDIAMDFEKCRSLVKRLLEGKILVGHALRNDLTVLDLHHPWYDTRDTAKYEPFMKKDKNTSMLRPRKLKDLTATKLERIIQEIGAEHCPIEDAIAALDLYKKARSKWEKAMSYKIQRTRNIENEQVMTDIDLDIAQ